jgi:cell division protease FtsH
MKQIFKNKKDTEKKENSDTRNSGRDENRREKVIFELNLNNFFKNWGFFILVIIMLFVYPYITNNKNANKNEVSISKVVEMINENKVEQIDVKGQILNIKVGTTTYTSKKELESGVSETFKNFGVATETLSKIKINVMDESGFKYWLGALGIFLPILFFGLMIFMLLRSVKGANMGALSFGNTRAKKIMPDDKNAKVTFADVAGAKVAKQELAEIVEFLKKPEKFLDIGAVIPKRSFDDWSSWYGKDIACPCCSW